MLIYYVYAYLRKDHTPYYIGKGKKSRAFHPHGKIAVPKDKSLIVFLETNLSEVGAFALERRMVRWYGRKDLGTGILRNLTDGGEGGSGLIHSEETRRKRSEAAKKNMSEEHRRKISEANKGNKSALGYKHSEETRRKISEANKRRTLSGETRRKLSAALKSRKLSEETRRKISEAARKREARKRITHRHSSQVSVGLSVS